MVLVQFTPKPSCRRWHAETQRQKQVRYLLGPTAPRKKVLLLQSQENRRNTWNELRTLNIVSGVGLLLGRLCLDSPPPPSVPIWEYLEGRVEEQRAKVYSVHVTGDVKEFTRAFDLNFSNFCCDDAGGGERTQVVWMLKPRI